MHLIWIFLGYAVEEEEKRFRKKRQLEEGEDSEEESEPDDDVPAGKWGRKKSAYYDDGEVCFGQTILKLQTANMELSYCRSLPCLPFFLALKF